MAIHLHKLKKDESRDEDGKPIYLTMGAIEALRKELDRLKRRLPAAADEAARTAAYGDRSDNAEYKQAKGALRRIHYRIFEIETQLKHAVPINVDTNKTGTVQLGSTVTVETNIARSTFQILGPHETDPARGRISHLSPLGAALIDHREGDIVTVATGRGPQTYRILEIR